MSVCALGILTLLQACLVCGDLSDVSTENMAVQQEIVDLHNGFRRSVNPPASNMLKMNWSAEVASNAQSWANTCAMGHGLPSSREIAGYECGENLFKSEEALPWTDVVGAWHNEVKNYQYPNGSKNGGVIGHFTQVVWAGSYEVGCGVASCPNSTFFYACHYFRAGNFIGVAPYTEGTWCGDCPNNCDDKLCTNPCPYVNKYKNCPTLKAMEDCWDAEVMEGCPGSCSCKNKIVPVN